MGHSFDYESYSCDGFFIFSTVALWTFDNQGKSHSGRRRGFFHRKGKLINLYVIVLLILWYNKNTHMHSKCYARGHSSCPLNFPWMVCLWICVLVTIDTLWLSMCVMESRDSREKGGMEHEPTIMKPSVADGCLHELVKKNTSWFSGVATEVKGF